MKKTTRKIISLLFALTVMAGCILINTVDTQAASGLLRCLCKGKPPRVNR